jgi:hypothetical protein
MNSTARLAIPLIAPGQAQKEVSHNEALQAFDLLVAACVEEPPRNAPPASPVIGACYIVGTAPTGAWVGQSGSIAGYTMGGWRFIPPATGIVAFVRNQAICATYHDGDWDLGTVRGSSLFLRGQQVIGPRAAAIASPSGGSTVDTEARSTLNQLLSTLRAHGLIET